MKPVIEERWRIVLRKQDPELYVEVDNSVSYNLALKDKIIQNVIKTSTEFLRSQGYRVTKIKEKKLC